MRTTFGFREECGIFGIHHHPEASNIVYLGLYGLQHRGQESAGIVSTDGRSMYSERRMGYVADGFDREKLNELAGSGAIGHVRYSTKGGSSMKNAQPVVISCWRGTLALSHNGTLVNAVDLRRDLERKGSIFQTTTDSEVIMHLIAKADDAQLVDALATALKQIKGAYSLLVLTNDLLIGVRDPHGFRPLVLGELDRSPVLASETCALDLIGAKFIREVNPGEMLVINREGQKSFYPVPSERKAFCIFELVYFARPDSIVFGQSVYAVRKEMGRQLAAEHPADVDMVVPVPDSGIGAALGFAEAGGIPFEMGLIRNHYIGRTFIEPRQSIRDFGVKIKLNPVRAILEGKRVVVVDDSIVRGTTSRKLVRMFRVAGAREVHVRISSPPTIGTCCYGIDTPNPEELIANRKNVEQIREFIEADSLGYLSVEGLLKSSGSNPSNYCTACFSMQYPIQVESTLDCQPSLFEK
ncbi:amidophosphoribosyltransferase [bacterium]|nr:amidophosphoribosyltransferase [candidate division CSSED10-310 bacterium]